MGGLFAHFDKNILIFEKIGEKFLYFLMIYVSAGGVDVWSSTTITTVTTKLSPLHHPSLVTTQHISHHPHYQQHHHPHYQQHHHPTLPATPPHRPINYPHINHPARNTAKLTPYCYSWLSLPHRAIVTLPDRTHTINSPPYNPTPHYHHTIVLPPPTSQSLSQSHK